MARMILDATDKQSEWLQKAVDVFNAANDNEPPLTVKRWIYRVLGEAVENQLAGQQAAAAQNIRNTIRNDMAGGT